MEGAKLEKARQAAAMAVDKLGDDDIFSLVTYDDQTDLLIPPERATEEDAILARIRAGERIGHFETVRVAKDGRRVYDAGRPAGPPSRLSPRPSHARVCLYRLSPGTLRRRGPSR